MNNIERLPALILGPDKPDYSVIWMHGLGADGHDFEPIVTELDFSNKHKTRFIFPHAPDRAVTINNGHMVPAWYDILALEKGAQEDEEGIRRSEKQITQILENEISSGVLSKNIVLAGFSQGGALALHTALRFSQTLAGILALSTYLPLFDSLATERSAQNKDTNIQMMHGEYDSVVPLDFALLSKQRLFELDWSVQWQTYPMDHGVCPQQINDISQWFGKVLV